MTIDALTVCLHGEPVGVLSRRGDYSSFAFLDRYLELPARPVLGQLFEDAPRRRWGQAVRLPAWFGNLLPEDGPLRDFLITELELRDADEFSLIRSLGADLPGAVDVIPFVEGDSGGPENREVIEAELGTAHGGEAAVVRFSVAGVQMKLSMLREDNTLRLAGQGEWGGHYVKFPGVFADIPANEHASMSLGRFSGLKVADFDLMPATSLGELPPRLSRLADRDVYVTRRFDRTAAGRVHIEDLNQARGWWPERKYQGATFESLGRVLLAVCGLEDFLEYVRRLAFMYLIGNEDAHLKNWSLIYPDGVTARLSPAYDLVSTVQFDVDRQFALKFGDSYFGKDVRLATFRRLATKVSVDPKAVEAEVVSVTRRFLDGRPALEADVAVGTGYWARLEEHGRTLPFVGEVRRLA